MCIRDRYQRRVRGQHRIKMVRGDGAGNIIENSTESNRTGFSRSRFDKKCSGFGSRSEFGTLKSNFSRTYNRGEIPCRINHGGVSHNIQWDLDPNDLPYDPLLILFFEGLVETAHPFVFLAVSYTHLTLPTKRIV
eukprot:TRINITY_DN1777_c0_g1_i2.p1 TRINITY_DN1777_c0_g1~~TRINITY_DN1777_c0_g1_i2.p1  ORF type:complete len:135 (-),score=15.47 TRINITY_DN1777_c0_g1_i2:102-506(-)